LIDAAEELRGIYSVLSDAWRAWISDKSIGGNCPAVQWLSNDLPETTVTTAEVLLMGVEFTVMQTGLAIRDHLNSLSSAYPTSAIRRAAPATWPWPGSSAFTLARSILEGSGLITWLLDGAVDHNERMRRSARLILWSAHHGNTWATWADAAGNTPKQIASPDHWKRMVEEAGLPVTTWRGQFVVERPFRHTEVIRAAFGGHGIHLYNRWSGATHHAPWVLTPGTYLRPDENGRGLYMGTSSGLADHVDAAADVSDMILTSSESIRTYWGRTATTNAANESASKRPSFGPRLPVYGETRTATRADHLRRMEPALKGPDLLV
jgi:hypothetical protein